MKCSPFDLRDYFLKELTVPQAAQVEEHIHSCPDCREEFDRLRLTEAALFSLRDEEIPQRIAFVSDKIFEPSPVRRWFSAFWGSAGRLGFASAAMLSAAIVFSSVNKTPAPALVQDRATIQPTVPPGPTAEEIQARIDKAVATAVEQAVTQSKETTRLIADLRHENELANAQLVRATGYLEMYQRREKNNQRNVMAVAQPADGGDAK
jgi:anti-sigma factor RsiW